MRTPALLSQLVELDIKLWLEGERLRYSAPHGAMTAELQAEMVKHKAEIIAYLQRAADTAHNTNAPIVPLPRPEKIPLSFAQQRLWIIDQLEPGNPAYHIFNAAKLCGPLDIDALRRALQETIQRHESLRTTFQNIDGELYQLILPELDVPLPLIDATGASQAEIEARIRAEGRQPFDLARGPLVRGNLLRLGEEEHILFLSMHHIISDGWSIGLLSREIVLLAQAFAAGKPNPLAPLPFQYADFAVWQRHHLQGDVLNEQLGYWKKQLDGAPAALELPTDHPRPAEQTFRGARLYVDLPRSLNDQLQALCRREGVTLFMLLLAAFDLLLARYSGQNDIVIGSPVANRNRAEIEGLIGLFVNTLVLRTDLSGNPTFNELLQRVREVTLGAFDHQDLPFEKLVDELQVRRDLSRNPLFQVMLVLLNAPLSMPDLSGLTMEQLEIELDSAQFDLSMTLQETPSGLAGFLEYNTDLFEPATITRLFGHFQRLLEAIAAHPAYRLSQLELLTPPERQQLLIDWNDTAVDYPSASRCIHELFEQQAERTPDAPAITFEGNSLSYQQLNQRANQLAHFLQQQGAGPETLVGICLQRSLEMVIGLLGILKAGAAYVPLDPTYPPERLAYMLGDANVPILLSQHALRETLPPHAASLVCLDSDWDTLIAPQPTHNPHLTLAPDNLAYMIYTSGSTGKPKGAMNSQRAITNRLLWMQQAYSLSPADSVLQKTPFSFDVSVWEFFWPLITGARLVLARPEGHKDSSYLAQLIIQEHITTLHFVPSMLRIFLDDPASQDCLSLTRVICSGEALPFDAQQQFFLSLPHAQLYNLYGPTEAAVDVTAWTCQPNDPRHIVPIGRPIANTQIRILDTTLTPVPLGVAGELHIGGLGLGRGYLGRPELTAEKFIPDPFSARPGARLYRTGDLVRWLPDGAIEYLGRIDHQVKLRGFRIELGEIESALSQLPGIREVAVLLREDRSTDKKLVAYLVRDPAIETNTSQLRAALKERLPDYMIPAAFVFLERFPLSPNGKIDRKAFPAPDQSTVERSTQFVAPRTETESVLAGIWSKVLGIERIGIHDNFFELGGDSLLSMRVIGQAHQAGLNLVPRQMFQSQTIAELAELIEHNPIAQEDTTQAVSGDTPLAPNQHWFFDQDFTEQHVFNIASLFDIDRALKLEPSLVKQAVHSLLVHHDALRMRFIKGASGWRGSIAPPDENIPFKTIDLSELPYLEQMKVIEAESFEAQNSFDLSTGPLMKVILFQMGANTSSRLLFALHHLVTDAYSNNLLMEDFATAYQQLTRGETIQLPPKTTSFKTWVEKLVEYSRSPQVVQELELWQSGPQEQLPQSMPPHFPGAKYLLGVSFQIRGALTSDETRILAQEVTRKYDVQFIELMLAAMAEALATTKPERSLYVDILLQGRGIPLEGINLARTVGWTVLHYPLLLQLEKTSGLLEALPLVKEQYRRPLYAGVGYDLLRYMNGDEKIKQALRPRPSIVFSHESIQQGPTETLIRPAPEFIGYTTSGEIVWPYGLELRTVIVANELHWYWTSGETLYQRATIEKLSQSFGNVLRQLLS